ncbi:prepilin-type N-terminal cleavage/methylation domain-containing protein [Photobacterium carnosum]|uniref:GspH/FimT family pseudopilin n=1 Tax=Photobacterium carnosum TaxID=2023717 RepID=UPI001E5FF30F|nr:GspH/FimT family pseudopilin [Photobacterium carnosum]MCD9554658.1 prepilin-type N-terminal cleavage/methylation domain-containing protein [Photobacterium carnosum]
MKNQGFTLLELVFTIAILAIVLATAAPSFHSLMARNKVERTVTELKGLFIAAKSEAVMRNREVYLHTVGLTDTKTYTDDWCVIATTEPTANSCTTNSNTLYIVDGRSLTGLNIKRHQDYATIKIDSMNGHPKFNAGEGIIDWLTFEKESGKAVTMQMHMFGRLY